MNWGNLIIYIAFAITIASAGYWIVSLYYKNKELASVILQLIIDNKILTDKIQQDISSQTIENSDGFLKFVTESRDWAFSYIEEVQDQLNKFVEVSKPIMEYYDKYGRIAETVHTPSMDKLFDAYNELIKVLPETENKQGENNE